MDESATPSATPVEMNPQLRYTQALIGLKWAEEQEITALRRRYEEEKWRVTMEYEQTKGSGSPDFSNSPNAE